MIKKSRLDLGRGIFLFVLLILLSGCSRYHAPDQLIVDLPNQFKEQGENQNPKAQNAKDEALALNLFWWESFKDPHLNGLVEKLLEGNLALKQAQSRTMQMRALAGQAGSQLWPTLDLNLGFSRRKQLNMFSRLRSPASGASNMPTSFQIDNYTSALQVNYELDLWGRLKSLSQAAEIDAIATEQDMQAMAMSLISTLVDLWLQSIESKAKLKLIQNQLIQDEKLLSLSKERFSQGLGVSIDFLQQTQQRDRTQAQIPMLEAQISVLERKISALLGQTQQQITIPEQLPIVDQALPKLGLPSEVLFARPDVRAAHAKLKAADARVVAAVTARYPAFRIAADIGYQSFEIENLFKDWVGSIATNLISPLFDAGRRASEQRRMEEMLKERVSALAEVSLNAFNEIEDAITYERQQKSQAALIQKQVASATLLLDRAKSRYLEGVGDFLTVVTATQGLYQAQISLLTAQRQALSYKVLFHKAVGGEIVVKETQKIEAQKSTQSHEKVEQK